VTDQFPNAFQQASCWSSSYPKANASRLCADDDASRRPSDARQRKPVLFGVRKYLCHASFGQIPVTMFDATLTAIAWPSVESSGQSNRLRMAASPTPCRLPDGKAERHFFHRNCDRSTVGLKSNDHSARGSCREFPGEDASIVRQVPHLSLRAAKRTSQELSVGAETQLGGRTPRRL